MEQIKELMEKTGLRAVGYRRHLHRYPDLSEHEERTMRYICAHLDALDVPYQAGVADTGVVALIEGGRPGRVVGLRADMDALPIQEENRDAPYCSQHDGVMHACGHDAHTAVLMGVAEVLAPMRRELKGAVKLIFQPAEETVGGAQRMIEAGCLGEPEVDYMLGLHVAGDLPAGQIGIKYGKMYAASDMLTVRVRGMSCHGAHPSEGVDAVLIAAAIVMNVQSVVSRNIDALDSCVVTFGTIRGGNIRNQVADAVELTGIIRTLTPETRLYARQRVKTVCEETAKLLGGSAELIVEPGYDPLINTDRVVDLVRDVACDALGAQNVILRPAPSLGVEDFACFAAAKPACFFHLGCAAADPSRRIGHSSRFDIDEACIPVGIRLQVLNTLRLLAED